MSFSPGVSFKVKLADITLKITKGTTPTTIGRDFTDSGVNYYKAQCITNSKYLDKKNMSYIDFDTHEKLKRSQMQKNDILFSMAGVYLGKTCIVKKEDLPSNTNQAVGIIRLNQKLADPEFTYYYLNQEHIIKFINNSTSQSAQPNINLKEIGDITINLPSIKEQKTIAYVLSILDEKIEVNNRMNKLLKNLAQQIFKRWFVDFEFPNEEGEPYKSSCGEMVESELGLIPKEWKVGSIYSIADIIYGAPFSSKLFNEAGEGLPLIRIRDLKSGNPQFYTTETHRKGTIIIPGDIIIGMDAEFRPTIWTGKKAYLNQRVYQIKSNKEYIHDYFLYELIKPHMQFFEFSKVGTTVIHLGKSDIDSIKVIIPTFKHLVLYSKLINPIHGKIVSLSIENRELRNLRDTLLPKLMSGEIRVPIEES